MQIHFFKSEQHKSDLYEGNIGKTERHCNVISCHLNATSYNIKTIMYSSSAKVIHILKLALLLICCDPLFL